MKRRVEAGRITDLKEGEMKQVEIGDDHFLLVRIDGDYHAYTAYCTHYGAPLAKGCLSAGRIVCPWHHAGFCARSGNLRNPPALDALPEYPVEIENDTIYVHLPEEPARKRLPGMTRHDPTRDSRLFAIVGGGAAGSTAVEALREAGFQGRVLLISREQNLPYDRTLLSKAYMAEGEDKDYMPLRSDAFYRDLDIELILERSVNHLDVDTRTILLDNNQSITYDKALIATGGSPRRLDIPGADLQNIFTLRTPDDANRIIAAARQAKRAVIMGASFIGMECASSLTKRGVEITVVAPEMVPFASVLGEPLGNLYRKLHEENGVTFRLGTQAERLLGDDGVSSVVLNDGSTLPADFIVLGVGIDPITGFIRGVPREDDGSLRVAGNLAVIGSEESLFAAGDIATFPDPVSGKDVRIEHWRVAQQHGRLTARSMMGESTPYSEIPFFWSGQFGKQLRYVGHAVKWDDTIIDGTLAEYDFSVYYVRENRIIAAAAINRDQQMTAFAECLRRKLVPAPEEVRRGIDWAALVQQ